MTTTVMKIADLNGPMFPTLCRALTTEERDGLKESIKQIGVCSPVAIDEDNWILNGDHRTQLSRELGLKEIPVVVHAGLDKVQKLKVAFDLNNEGRHNTNADRATSALTYRELGMSIRQIAEQLGVSPKTVRNDLDAVRVSTGESDSPVETVVGKDGKNRAAQTDTKKEQFQTVQYSGVQAVKDAVRDKILSLKEAADIASLPQGQQAKAVATRIEEKREQRKAANRKTNLAEKATAAVADEDPPEDESIEDQIKRKNAELEAWCRDLMKFAETMPDDPWLQDMNKREGALRKLKDCCATIRSAKCHCPCTKCDGSGCKHCHKTGRLTKFALDQL